MRLLTIRYVCVCVYIYIYIYKYILCRLVGKKLNWKLNLYCFDVFQIESDTKNCDPKRDPKCIPKLTEAEALCKYGQSGQARADACKAVKASGGKMPEKGKEGKSLGGAYAM